MSVAKPQTTLTITNLASAGGSPVVISDPSGYDLTSTVITFPGDTTVSTMVSPDYFVNVTPQLLDLTSRSLITYSGGTGSDITLHVNLVNLAGAGPTANLIKFVPGVSGRLAGISAQVAVAYGGATASVPLQLFVFPSGGSNTPCTGGLVTLTDANTGTVLSVVAGSAVTAGGTFGPADAIGVNQSASTGFDGSAGDIILAISVATI